MKQIQNENQSSQYYFYEKTLEDISVCHSSLTKKSNKQFYNSIYDLNFSTNSDDLAQLETFDEQSIMTYMYNRFLTNQIYTYIGDILVVSFRKKTKKKTFLSCFLSGY